jgi:magnesium-transporting ATPase (P-type)
VCGFGCVGGWWVWDKYKINSISHPLTLFIKMDDYSSTKKKRSYSELKVMIFSFFLCFLFYCVKSCHFQKTSDMNTLEHRSIDKVFIYLNETKQFLTFSILQWSLIISLKRQTYTSIKMKRNSAVGAGRSFLYITHPLILLIELIQCHSTTNQIMCMTSSLAIISQMNQLTIQIDFHLSSKQN